MSGPLRPGGARRQGRGRTRHLAEEHTGELAIRIEAPTLPALFEEAGRALSRLMRGRGRHAEGGGEERLALTAPDREALLAEWLNELVFRAETEHRLFTAFRVERVSDRELVARVRGVQVRQLRNPVKAATLHRLRVAQGAGGFTARVVLDV